MNTVPSSLTETTSLTDHPLNGSPNPSRGLGGVPPLPESTNSPSHNPLAESHAGKKSASRLWRFWSLAVGILVIGGGIGLTAMLTSGSPVDRPDLLYHTVKRESLAMTIIERGTLESAENRDVICKVRASKGGSFATTITWVIEDGSHVEQGQHIATLDDASLDLQQKDQNIAVLNAQAALISAQTAFEVSQEDNKKIMLAAENALRGAELDLEKYIGMPRGTLTRLSPEVRADYIREIEKDLLVFLTKHRIKFTTLDGEFQQLLDDVNGRIGMAEAEHEQWKDKSAYSQRMVIKGYITQSQAQADESRLSSASETLKKLRTERRLLETFVAQKAVSNYCSLLKEAEVSLTSARISAAAKLKQADAEKEAKKKTLEQEKSKLDEIRTQILNCKIYAPQKGLVVYYVPEQSRFGGGSQQSIVAQGEPVREGQKLMRIPDLDYMQVVARVHEATIARIKPDRPTYFTEAVRAAAVVNRNVLPQIYCLHEDVLAELNRYYSRQEEQLTVRGQSARIRVDAFNDQPLRGHVRSIATVATQEFFSSDVKVYQTIVSIDDKLKGLRPGMSAEVSIQVEDPLESVLTVPVQAILGGPEGGNKRKVYVYSEAGPQEREVIVGLSNDEKAEIREGLQEGDRVVTNLRALLGDKIKTRDPNDPKTSKGQGGRAKAKVEAKK